MPQLRPGAAKLKKKSFVVLCSSQADPFFLKGQRSFTAHTVFAATAQHCVLHKRKGMAVLK